MARVRRSALHSPAAWACLLVPLVIGLAADLLSKEVAFERLNVQWFDDAAGTPQVRSDAYDAIPNYLTFQAHVNYGAVFGIGQGARVLFIVVSLLAIALLGYLFVRSGAQRLYQILVGMLLAGVLGNLYDRAVHGYVRDMIYALPGWQFSDLAGFLPAREIFPWIFNIADSLLCVGVFGMFVYSLFAQDQDAAETGADVEAKPVGATPERVATGHVES
jgi:signal peptidase II